MGLRPVQECCTSVVFKNDSSFWGILEGYKLITFFLDSPPWQMNVYLPVLSRRCRTRCFPAGQADSALTGQLGAPLFNGSLRTSPKARQNCDSFRWQASGIDVGRRRDRRNSLPSSEAGTLTAPGREQRRGQRRAQPSAAPPSGARVEEDERPRSYVASAGVGAAHLPGVARPRGPQRSAVFGEPGRGWAPLQRRARSRPRQGPGAALAGQPRRRAAPDAHRPWVGVLTWAGVPGRGKRK